MFLKLLEPISILVIVALGIFQVVLPIADNRPIFPMFRRRKLTSALAAAYEEKDQAELKNQIEQVKKGISDPSVDGESEQK